MRDHRVRFVVREEVVAAIVIQLILKHHFVLYVIKEEQTSQIKFADFVVD